MKVLAFLHPIYPIMDELAKGWPGVENPPYARMNELLRIRYRDQGYRVFWLMFSVEGKKTEADTGLISSLIVRQPEDVIIPMGSSLRQNVEDLVYPDPAFAFDQLPGDTEEIKVGGFHLYSCVSRFAEHCYNQGAPTLVDEDLTHVYFCNLTARGPVPDHRQFTAEGFGYERLMRDAHLGPDFIKDRIACPWLVQPTGAH